MIEIPPPVLRWQGWARVEVSRQVDLSQGPLGALRVVPITGGRLTGEWEGKMVPGGADWQTVHVDGDVTLAAVYPVELTNGRTVCIVARGARRATADDGEFCTSLLFDGGVADTCTGSVFVARGKKANGAVEFDIFAVDPALEGRAASPDFRIDVLLRPPIQLSDAEGWRRSFIPIVGGAVTGRLEAAVVEGGGDWAVERDDGSMNISARYLLRAGDGTVIEVENIGRWRERTNGDPYFVTAPVFRVSDGPYAWLRSTVFVGMAHEIDETHIVIDVYSVDGNGNGNGDRERR